MKPLEVTYMEEHLDSILREHEFTKREFANRLGILSQNVDVWARTKNIVKLSQMAVALGEPLEYLLYGPEKCTSEDIRGYLDYRGKVYRIASKEDILQVLQAMKQD